MEYHAYTILVLSWFASLADAAEFCLAYGSIIYCSDICCGGYNREYCCSSVSSGTIAGAVVGSIIFACFVLAIIICACKKVHHRGTVIGANPVRTGPNVIQISTHAAPAPAPVPAYRQHVTLTTHLAPPPTNTQLNPAYPPPAATYIPPKQV